MNGRRVNQNIRTHLCLLNKTRILIYGKLIKERVESMNKPEVIKFHLVSVIDQIDIS